MADKRENRAMMIIGRKRTGKSTLANKIAKGFARPKKRTLIIDVNGSPAYAEHEMITYEKLRRYRSGSVYKFYDPNIKRMFDFLTTYYGPQYDEHGNKIGERLFNGLFVFEDCTKYIDPNPSKQVRTFLVDHRMWNADLLFTFHSLAFVPPFFWKMTTQIILLKTQEEIQPAQYKGRIPNWEKVYAAWKRVMANPDPYAHEVVDTLI